MFGRLLQRGQQPPPSPRQRRLESDHARLTELAANSSIFSFVVVQPKHTHSPPETYRIQFRGSSLQTVMDANSNQTVRLHYQHEVLIQLVAEYPRSAPHMRWVTPIFHPNISAAGAVCLGGWGTHWAPSLQLDKLCEMLWDMLRFANYDTRSPFNQQAATWLRKQREYQFPLDHRELRDAPQSVAKAVSPPDKADSPPLAQPIVGTLAEQTDLREPANLNNADDDISFDDVVERLPPQRRAGGQPPTPTPPPDILFLD